MRDDRPPQDNGEGGRQGAVPTGGIDLRKVPFAEWLEEVLPELCRMYARCIGFVALLKDGATATNYWNAVGNDVALMAYQMTEDALLATLRSNKNLLRRILEAGEDEDPEPAEDEEEETEGP